MKRLISIATSTAMLTAGVLAVAAPASAAPTSKWRASLSAVQEAGTATGSVQIVQTRSKKAPIYSFSVKAAGLAVGSCYEVASSADGLTRSTLGSATSSATGTLAFAVKVVSASGHDLVVVSACGAEDVLAGGPFVARAR